MNTIFLAKILLLFQVMIVFNCLHASGKTKNHVREQIDRMNQYLSTDIDSVEILANELLLLQQTGTDSVTGIANFYLGIVNYYRSDYLLSSLYYQRALETDYALENEVFRGRLWSNLGVIYDLTDRYSDAIEAYLKSMEVDENNGDLRGVAQSKINIGLLYSHLRQTKEAEKYLNEALTFFEQENDEEGKALAFQNLGKLSMDLMQYEIAKDYFAKALELYNETGNKLQYVNVLNSLTFLLTDQNNLSGALEIIEKSIDISVENGFKHQLSRARLNKVEYLMERGDFQQAYDLLKNIETFNYNLAYKKHLHNVLISSQLREYDSLVDTLNVFLEFINDRIRKNNTKLVNELHIQYQSAEKAEKIQKQELIIRQKNQVLYLAASFTVVLIIFLLVLYIYNRRLQKSYRMLYRNQSRLSKGIDFVDSEIMTRTKLQDPSTFDTEEKAAKEAGANKDLWLCILKTMKEQKPYLKPGLSLNDLALHCNSNKTYVYKTIKFFYKENFSSFINQFRVDKAKELLINHPNFDLPAIADLAGFNSVSSFYRIFKDYTGLTPSKFRIISREVELSQKQ